MFSTAEILGLRPAKKAVNWRRPAGYFVELERSPCGEIEQVATILLTGRECIFRCLMCDLWKNTLDEKTPPGALVTQIDEALANLPVAQALKLYNSSNFFDPGSVPLTDYAPIAERARRFSRVIVENHPRLCNENCRRFAEFVSPSRLEVAMGLETVHGSSLRALNKQMTVGDFARATTFLRQADIDVRAFVLLGLPDMDEGESVHWAVRSVQAAFDMGAHACSIIATRAGNGAMDRLEMEGRFRSVSLRSLELACQRCVSMHRGRVFADLWDAEQLDACTECRSLRIERLRQMNLHQQVPPGVSCSHCPAERATS